ncbi:hypothetical protein W97_02707 [Coniosporium apollinis CBS 100218]|uniref:Serine/threonine-protein kinase ppk6 n=1 Tax=Coniosporium apollinis (strain CBS 100218) TaxID=1168221 RepID=R7YNT7_CONA1|nr:uncharacterized protein W97_02707 [Coniosporium apollinis CBS 100218]EON63479.1 hypothetical protein W97_02707 [Coniosporium apollinis CBS 100218]
MSKDLLAEFGDFGQDAKAASSTNLSNRYSSNSSSFFEDISSRPGAQRGHRALRHGQGLLLDVFSDGVTQIQHEYAIDQPNDDWGDFEDAEPSVAPSSTQHESKTQEKQNLEEYIQQSRKPVSVQTSAHDKANSFDGGHQSSRRSEPLYDASDNRRPPGIGNVPRAKDPNILFDASQELGEDDDFGDFEGGTPGPAESAEDLDIFGIKSNMEDLRPEDRASAPVKASRTAIPATAERRSRKPPKRVDYISQSSHGKPAPARAVRTAVAPTREPLTTAKPEIPEESWDDFTAWEAPAPLSTKSPDLHAERSDLPLAAPLGKSVTEPSPSDLPPTNVPPPALLLSLFPPLFVSAQEKFFKPLAAQPYAIRNRILAAPATTTFLQGYLALATVAARIIAGRKLRWKRDTRLAQSMKIGPSSGGRSTGMKLTGVDRGEERKEEREVLDVVGAWQEQLGRLRSAVAGSKALGAVPEIHDAMPVRMAKQSEGGVPAPRCCALCGLKRDERVGKVDENVIDSFGEWWIEQMSMHRGCRNFWEQHKDELRQR